MKVIPESLKDFFRKNFVLICIFTLVVVIVALISLGILMLTSTGPYANDSRGNPTVFLKGQLIGLGVGALGLIIAAWMDYRRLGQLRWWLYGFTALLLALCLIPGVGKKLNGARRWLSVAGFTIQPSELAKLTALVMLAWWYSQKEMLSLKNKTPRTKEFVHGFVRPLAMVLGLVALIVVEVDLGTSCIIAATAMLVMFVAGARVWHLGAFAFLGAAALASAVYFMPERMGRFLAFCYPEIYQEDAHQQIMGIVAFISGGLEGRGLGNGMQKFFYLPYAHTDFIFPMVGEELGLWTTLAVVGGFLVILLAGAVIALKSSDQFGKLLGFGIVTLLALQALLNMGVTTMLLPNKGLPLPFISYGGSNLAFSLAGIGVLISIYRRGYGEETDPESHRLHARIKTRATPRM